MIDFLILFLIAAIVTAIVLYIRREKKRGAKCIGCPHASTCGGSCCGSGEPG